MTNNETDNDSGIQKIPSARFSVRINGNVMNVAVIDIIFQIQIIMQ